ncbi:MAG TPA: glutamine synthetase family protein [Bryobacteraceae bacterium]|nr:glutamine synthetase family protein [Bryobacteraceae bacterium]
MNDTPHPGGTLQRRLQNQEKLRDLDQQVKGGHIDTVIAAFTDHYGRLMGKRFDAAFFLESVASGGTHACNYLLTVDMEMEPTPGYKFANWELGYGDFHLVPDLSTLRTLSWQDKTAFVHCDIADDKAHAPVTIGPRSILKSQLQSAAGLGFTALGASELEYYIYRESYKKAAKNGYAKLEPLGWYLEDYNLLQGTRQEFYTREVRRHLKATGFAVESSKGEWGLGQHEVNVKYSEVLEMADNHALLKQCMKEIADQTGVSVTFMAKPHHGQAGSSCHIHLSLRKDGKNAFAADGANDGTDEFRWFLGGWMAHACEMMVFYAPTINSYKRFEDMSWAPTRIAWSRDNRTAGFRVVGAGQSLRIECRIPGADANPYLAFAASLASGLDGIKNKIEPPPVFEGDVYAARTLPRVPYTLEHAIDLFEASEFAKSTFGPEVVEHYTHFFRNEQKSFERTVTDWERRRYFERI